MNKLSPFSQDNGLSGKFPKDFYWMYPPVDRIKHQSISSGWVLYRSQVLALYCKHCWQVCGSSEWVGLHLR